MNERIRFLRGLEPRNSGQGSYLAILEAAAGLFQQFPADAITLRDILALSGVSNQTLYNYFPDGRDDVALILFDRFQRAELATFRHLVGTIDWKALTDAADITRALGACLTHATIGSLKGNRQLQATVCTYLKSHHRGFWIAHSEELEEALRQEILLRYGPRFSAQSLPLAVRLGARLMREVADLAMAHPEYPLPDLESKARKLLRTLLQSGLRSEEAESGNHEFAMDEARLVPIAGAPISPSRRQAILDRIFKRRRSE